MTLVLGTIEISGAVKPGIYRIMQNDTIKSIIKKSGGLLENAYLKGMIYTREEEKEREVQSIERLRRELDKAISMAYEKSDQVENVDISSIN